MSSDSSRQIKQMVNFIMQEAHEKVNEIRIKVSVGPHEKCIRKAWTDYCCFYSPHRPTTTLTWRSKTLSMLVSWKCRRSTPKRRRIWMWNNECKLTSLLWRCNIDEAMLTFCFFCYRSRSAAVGAARIKKMKARDELLEVSATLTFPVTPTIFPTYYQISFALYLFRLSRKTRWKNWVPSARVRNTLSLCERSLYKAWSKLRKMKSRFTAEPRTELLWPKWCVKLCVHCVFGCFNWWMMRQRS